MMVPGFFYVLNCVRLTFKNSRSAPFNSALTLSDATWMGCIQVGLTLGKVLIYIFSYLLCNDRVNFDEGCSSLYIFLNLAKQRFCYLIFNYFLVKIFQY
jgi:hypothetical protein